MRRRYAAGALILLAACVLLGSVALRKLIPQETAVTRVQAVLAELDSQPKEPEEVTAPADAIYESPIDFQDLWEMNPDIYALLQIPGMGVSHPVLQREGDDSYYLRRDSRGESSRAGSIFSESKYNGRDFTDPVSILYGHCMRSGEMFGTLQEVYSGEGGMEEYSEIVVYLPDQELHYQVFAAVPYSKKHVLYYHDFNDPEVFQAFLDKEVLSVRSINAAIDQEAEVSVTDRLLILSTCLKGDNQQRYLVVAKQLQNKE